MGCRKKLTVLALLVSLLASARPTSAAAWQSSVISDDAEAVALQKALEELSQRRKEVDALRASLGARDERIKVLEQIVADQDKLVELWKTAATERATANGLDAKIEALYKESVAKYEIELQRVRAERDAARRQRWLWALGGIVIGVALVVGRGGNP